MCDYQYFTARFFLMFLSFITRLPIKDYRCWQSLRYNISILAILRVALFFITLPSQVVLPSKTIL